MTYERQIDKTFEKKRGYSIRSNWLYTDYKIRGKDEIFTLCRDAQRNIKLLEVDVTKRKIKSYQVDYYHRGYINWMLHILRHKKLIDEEVWLDFESDVVVKDIEFKTKGKISYARYSEFEKDGFNISIPYFQNDNHRYVFKRIKSLSKQFLNYVGRNTWYDLKGYSGYHIVMNLNEEVLRFFDFLKKHLEFIEYEKEDNKHLKLFILSTRKKKTKRFKVKLPKKKLLLTE